MLFAGLQRQPVGHAPAAVLADPDKPARNGALMRRAAGEKGGMRPAISKWNAKTLRRAKDDIGTKIAGGLEKRQRQQIGGDDGKTAGIMDGGDRRSDIAHRAAASRIADQHTKAPLSIGGFRRFQFDLDPDRPCPCAQNGQSLRMRVRVDPEDGALATMRAERHRHALGGGRCLVEKRAVGDVHSRQLGDHCLEIQDRLEAALRDFRLIWCIGGIPGRIFQHVAKHHRRRMATVITHTDQRGDHLVLRRQRAHLVQDIGFGQGLRQVHLVMPADAGGDDLVEKRFQRRDIKAGKHGRDVMRVQPDMARLECGLRRVLRHAIHVVQ